MRDYRCTRGTNWDGRTLTRRCVHFWDSFEYLAADHEEVRCPKCGALAKSVLSPVHLKDVG